MTGSVTLNRDDTLEALGNLRAATGAKTAIPILANVLIESGVNGLRLVASDLTAEAASWVLTDTCPEWRTTVSLDLLFDAISSLPMGAEVEIEPTTGPGRLRVQSGRSRFNLPTLPAEDFPVVGAHEWEATFDLPADSLSHLLDRAGWAYATEEAKYYVSGPHLHVSGEGRKLRLTMVSTDGLRLAKAEIDAPKDAKNAPPITLPPRTARALQKVLAGTAGEVTVSLSGSLARFTAAVWQVTSKLIDPGFPDYPRLRGVDREAHPLRVGADIDALKASVRRALVSADGKDNSIILALEPGSLALSSRGERTGDAADQVEVEYDGEPVRLGVNGSNMLEALNRIGSGAVQIALTDANTPLVLTGDDPRSFALVTLQRI